MEEIIKIKPRISIPENATDVVVFAPGLAARHDEPSGRCADLEARLIEEGMGMVSYTPSSTQVEEGSITASFDRERDCGEMVSALRQAQDLGYPTHFVGSSLSTAVYYSLLFSQPETVDNVEKKFFLSPVLSWDLLSEGVKSMGENFLTQLRNNAQMRQQSVPLDMMGSDEEDIYQAEGVKRFLTMGSILDLYDTLKNMYGDVSDRIQEEKESTTFYIGGKDTIIGPQKTLALAERMGANIVYGEEWPHGLDVEAVNRHIVDSLKEYRNR